MGHPIQVWRFLPDAEPPLIPIIFATQPDTLNRVSEQLPEGAYTTFRTFGRFRILPLRSHFDRLEETARLAGQAIALDRAATARFLHSALATYPEAVVRVRLSLDLEQEPGALYLAIEPLKTPEEADYQNGVCVVTRNMQRSNPKAKLTGFLNTASAVRSELRVEVEEALMIGEDGRALEGLSSNFFGVRGGTVWTAEAGVLSGITRATVFEVIDALGIPLQLEGVPVEVLGQLDEAFLTSASRGVLPVTRIDDTQIGDGLPGPVTRRLAAAYHARLEGLLEIV
jgi:branched-chain amino acid aminotransferase